MKIRAPAKINVRLRVVGKRADGYHLLDTVMVPITLFDELEIRKRPIKNPKYANRELLRITCDNPQVPDGEKNLVYRAAALLLEEAGVVQPLDINIRKRIPIGAGLGGGSTDAAAALVGINRLLKLQFSASRLEKLALRLGADVPFFIRPRPSRAQGIGEKLTPLRNVPPWWIVILYPGFPVSSAWVYSNVANNLTKFNPKTRLYTLLTRGPKLADLLVNDLEAVTLKRYRRIKHLKETLLKRGAAGALMTGSGSAVFGIFGSREKASKAFKTLRKANNVQAFLAQVISRPKSIAVGRQGP
ncbi:MAG TPA: 4-(cytidine 5'-diphospho)-2-C-methyl-D-erythritol kinase [Candidatus Binatia bacterium]|nr:4-(cytidine 5'-diphospho)-2-C-methyl-D-erythritol kinase [Candidatus Binatia bacterium]